MQTKLDAIRQQIQAAEHRYGRPAGSVQLLAVSKTFPVSAIQSAIDAGQRAFGENYLQEALEKIAHFDATEAGPTLEWHYIGAIQSNKTRDLASRFQWVHSVDRVKIARRLSEQRPGDLPPLNICLQVNISGETSKSGALPDELMEVAQEINGLPNIRLRGLMAIPAAAVEFDEQRAVFRKVALLQQQLIDRGLALDTLSMGMSDDMEAAIAEGATIVRIGSAIFGERDYTKR